LAAHVASHSDRKTSLVTEPTDVLVEALMADQTEPPAEAVRKPNLALSPAASPHAALGEAKSAAARKAATRPPNVKKAMPQAPLQRDAAAPETCPAEPAA